MAVFSHEEVEKLSVLFQFTLVASIKQHVLNKGCPSVRVQLLNQRHVLIFLDNAEEFAKLWLCREIFIESLPMRLFKWSPTFDVKQEPSVAPVWVRISGQKKKNSTKHKPSVSKSEAIKVATSDLHTSDVHLKTKSDFATDRVEYRELQLTKERLDHTEVPLQKSFADAVRGANVHQRPSNTSPTSFLNPQSPRFGRKETVDGESVVVFSANELQVLEEPLRFSLIGKFSFGRPQLRSIRSYFTAQRIGQFRVQLLNQKHILIELTNAEDYARIWLRREIVVEGLPMRLFKWMRNFDFQFESAIAPVWVRFEGLPLHLYNAAALFTIGELIGQPLKVDEATRLRSRTGYARVCIEVDLLKPTPESVKIQQDDELTTVPVVFEKMPKYCTYCKHVGHDEQDCYIKGPHPRPRRRFVRRPDAKDKGKELMENE
ncbi:hypothetical protein CDL12_29024 [Handroanthus impetiginosus]|uniref:DUF4283 domain-containing protein n=1 Tax=Handroanthus impetiginosus TaxID=429701 RepID=A0A2G9FZL7_9LAMI|nr:hypothetical protein CDL12_29024 [Handroanthus impetiginosus]